MEWKKGFVSGVTAGVVLTAISLLCWMVPSTAEWYSTTFPMMVAPEAMPAMTLSIFAVGLFMGLIYSVISPAVPGEGIRKGINYGIMVWLLAGLMWPIMMAGFAPTNVWMTELAAGLAGYAITGAAIAIIYSKL